MATLKIANWNIEWMNRWFTSDSTRPEWKTDLNPDSIGDLQGLAGRVADVVRAMDADVLCIQEGPSRRDEMGLFVSDHLENAYRILGPVGKGQQKQYALVKKASAVVANAFPVEDEFGFDFDDAWEVDIDADLVLDEYRFTRPPQVVMLETPAGPIRLLNCHTKSKYVHRGESLWRNPDRRQDFIEMALLARRRISAEAMRIRAYLNAVFDSDAEARIVVLGDFNDGPGLDFFEQRYLTHNVAGMIAGSPFAPRLMLRHAFIDQVAKADNWTAEFFDFIDETDRKVLLDHIFVSASLFWKGTQRAAHGTIEHALFDAATNAGLRGSREKHPSDHRPQTVTIEL